MRTTVGWGADDSAAALRRTPVERRDLRPDDLAVRVDYCGVCHSDLHAVQPMTAGRPWSRATSSPAW
ncbi:alcohol dehydrogenase catalytic domain-containing protein [Nonomuraea glycinis]|uniref:alcohol dehydrogenase catalytic domain-containing protein n=1 Tax=Nonomuraea glycinis TaxID=2047744 RepID=UPI0033A0F1CE